MRSVPPLIDLGLKSIVFLVGAACVALAFRSAVAVFVIPRGLLDPLAAFTFRFMRRWFDLVVSRLPTYEQRDRVMAAYGPWSLLAFVPVLVTLVAFGFTLMFWALGARTPYEAFVLSGSSLMTLGVQAPQSPAETVLAYLEAGAGLVIIALLIAYLPTIYNAYSQRETLVRLLETRAGTPPSAVYLFELAFPLGRMDHLLELWAEWEVWFAQTDETHTSLAMLSFFRSSQPDLHWLTAAGAVLDAAALYVSTLDYTRSAVPALCIRAGYLMLRHICDVFRISYPADPHFPADPISVTRLEFDEACARLEKAGVPLKPDRDQAWVDFAGWRVNYDRTLLGLCALTMPPPAPWSSDRMPPYRPLPLWNKISPQHWRAEHIAD